MESAVTDLDFIQWMKIHFALARMNQLIAVMEKANDAVVVPLNAGWSDVGSLWSSLWEIEGIKEVMVM